MTCLILENSTGRVMRRGISTIDRDSIVQQFKNCLDEEGDIYLSKRQFLSLFENGTLQKAVMKND